MTSPDGLDVFRNAFPQEKTVLTDAQRQIKRNAAGFAITVFGYGDLGDSKRQLALGLFLTQDQLKAAETYAGEYDLGTHNVGGLSTVLGETIPYQLSRTKNQGDLGDAKDFGIQEDPTGYSCVQHELNRVEDKATQAQLKAEGKKDEAEMLYKLLVQRAKDLPGKPINISGDVDEETAIRKGLIDSLVIAFGGDISPRARAIKAGIWEIKQKTGYELGEEGFVIPEVKAVEKMRTAAGYYQKAVDYYLSHWGGN